MSEQQQQDIGQTDGAVSPVLLEPLPDIYNDGPLQLDVPIMPTTNPNTNADVRTTTVSTIFATRQQRRASTTSAAISEDDDSSGPLTATSSTTDAARSITGGYRKSSAGEVRLFIPPIIERKSFQELSGSTLISPIEEQLYMSSMEAAGNEVEDIKNRVAFGVHPSQNQAQVQEVILEAEEEVEDALSTIGYAPAVVAEPASVPVLTKHVDQTTPKQEPETLGPAKLNTTSDEEEARDKVELVIPRLEDLDESQVDQYGFFIRPQSSASNPTDPRPPSSQEDGIASRSSRSMSTLAINGPKYRRREARWITLLKQLEADPRNLTRDNAEIKELCRKGLPDSVRARVWQVLAEVGKYRKEGVYEELLKRGPLPIYEIIERDIHRCYPDHYLYANSLKHDEMVLMMFVCSFKDEKGMGQKDLFDILKAYAHYNPDVGYFQGMGRLVGLMLMLMSAEETFWLLVATIDKHLHGFYTPDLARLKVHASVFEVMLARYLPGVSKHLIKNDVPPLIYMTPWFMTLYTMALPWPTVLRIWDMFYADGIKVLFRIGLAILDLSNQKGQLVKECPSAAELIPFLLHLPHAKFPPEGVIRRALKFRFSRDLIAKLEVRLAPKAPGGNASSSGHL